MANAFPPLEAAIRSRNNLDFRHVIVKLARAAESENQAWEWLSLFPAENLSAFLQFAEEITYDCERKAPQSTSTGSGFSDAELAALKALGLKSAEKNAPEPEDDALDVEVEDEDDEDEDALDDES